MAIDLLQMPTRRAVKPYCLQSSSDAFEPMFGGSADLGNEVSIQVFPDSFVRQWGGIESQGGASACLDWAEAFDLIHKWRPSLSVMDSARLATAKQQHPATQSVIRLLNEFTELPSLQLALGHRFEMLRFLLNRTFENLHAPDISQDLVFGAQKLSTIDLPAQKFLVRWNPKERVAEIYFSLRVVGRADLLDAFDWDDMAKANLYKFDHYRFDKRLIETLYDDFCGLTKLYQSAKSLDCSLVFLQT
jgi:Domain of unknown function (DUF1877)